MSEQVKRYDAVNPDGTCAMLYEDSDYGAYVLYDDYAALQAECAKLQEKVDKAWNRSHRLRDNDHIEGALDAWQRPVKQHLPYDFSGNPGALATQYCNGWNDAGGYWKGWVEDLQAECASLKNSLLAITTRHFAEGWKQTSKDSELEQYLSAGIAQLEEERDAALAERDALRAELAAIKEKGAQD